MEQWKSIPGYDAYEASSFGRVRIVVRRHNIHPLTILRMRPDKDGYLLVRLSRDGSQEDGRECRVARLIAMTFHGEIPDDFQVNHVNGVRSDDRPENLEIVTCQENIRHAIDTLGARVGERNGCAKMTDAKVLELRERAAKNETYASLSQAFGVSAVEASNIAKGKTWAHVGGPRSLSRAGVGRPKRD